MTDSRRPRTTIFGTRKAPPCYAPSFNSAKPTSPSLAAASGYGALATILQSFMRAPDGSINGWRRILHGQGSPRIVIDNPSCSAGTEELR